MSECMGPPWQVSGPTVGGTGSGWGTKILHAAWCSKKKKKARERERKKRKKEKEKKNESRDFLSSPVVKTAHFHCRKHAFDPWLGK